MNGGRGEPPGARSRSGKPAAERSGTQQGQPPGTEKLQKMIARAGLGSRRELENWIEAGRVSVNGRIASLGDRAAEGDLIRVDGRRIDTGTKHQNLRVLRYHKPVGVVCTRRDPEGRTTVFERLPQPRSGRWIAVGRLDINTSGLLLFTDSGDLANRLMHPSSRVARVYAVRIYGSPTPAVLKALGEGVQLDDGLAHFDTITDAGGEGRNHWYHVSVAEGRNRVVRRLWESQNIEVSRLIRIGYGGLELPRRLRPSRWEFLAGDELKTLLAAAGMESAPPRADSVAPARRPPPGADPRSRRPGPRHQTKNRTR